MHGTHKRQVSVAPISRANDGLFFYARSTYRLCSTVKIPSARDVKETCWALLLLVYISCASLALLSHADTHTHTHSVVDRMLHVFGTIVVAVFAVVVTFHFIFSIFFPFISFWQTFSHRIQSECGSKIFTHYHHCCAAPFSCPAIFHRA